MSIILIPLGSKGVKLILGLMELKIPLYSVFRSISIGISEVTKFAQKCCLRPIYFSYIYCLLNLVNSGFKEHFVIFLGSKGQAILENNILRLNLIIFI